MLDERSKEIDRGVASRMAAARIKYEQRFAGLQGAELSAMLSVVETRRDREVDNEDKLAIECPVCESPALAYGGTEQTDWDVDYDKEGYPESASPILTFFAGTIECEVCGLVLDGSDELEAAGLPTSWENEDLDPIEWARENLYDESFDY